ncbi:MAG: hypothetical protein ACKV1O_31070 [Saprospiraceae bacterium]
MRFESDFHQVIENTLTRIAWKFLGEELASLHRRSQLMRQPPRASNAEILVFERLTQIPAIVLIEKYKLGVEVLTENEIQMHAQRSNQQLPPYDSITTLVAGTGSATTTNPVTPRNKRTLVPPEVATS